MANSDRRHHIVGTRLCAFARPSGATVGSEEAVRHATWFIGAVENFRFFDLKVYSICRSAGAVAEVKGKGSLRRPAEDIARIMWCSCGLWRVRSRKITSLREYFDPARAATAMDVQILGLGSEDARDGTPAAQTRSRSRMWRLRNLGEMSSITRC